MVVLHSESHYVKSNPGLVGLKWEIRDTPTEQLREQEHLLTSLPGIQNPPELKERVKVTAA